MENLATLPGKVPNKPLIGVGTQVYAKFGSKLPFTSKQLEEKRNGKRPRQAREKLEGVVVRSAPASSWIVYFYGIKKTACIKYNKLVVSQDTSLHALAQVRLSDHVDNNDVDFVDYLKLQRYIDNLDFILSSSKKSKISAPNSVTPIANKSNLSNRTNQLKGDRNNNQRSNSVEDVSPFLPPPEKPRFVPRMPLPMGMNIGDKDGSKTQDVTLVEKNGSINNGE